MRVVSVLRGAEHTDTKSSFYGPFTIGDVNPSGDFIHVLDDATLLILLNELDTISDLTNYFTKKARFVRSGVRIFAAGEEEMLAEYVRHVDAKGEHEFVRRDDADWKAGDVACYDEGIYEEHLRDPRYLIRKKADQASYVWDKVIEAFTGPMLAGTTLVPDGGVFVLSDTERAVRFMALENRVMRRAHGDALMGAIRKSKETSRFFRAMIPAPSDENRKTGFFCMLLRYPADLDIPGGYKRYREVRCNMLEAYALGLMDRHRHLERVVGFAIEPPKREGEPLGSSEDIILLEPSSWTDELSAEAERMCAFYDILREGNFRLTQTSVTEYPVSKLPKPNPPSPAGLNRQQRRVLLAKQRRTPKA